jgi:hypothetical protein
MDDKIFNMKSAGYFMRHADNLSSDNNQDFDPEIDSPIIINQIDLAEELCSYVNDNIDLEEGLNFIDILDALASIGVFLSSIREDGCRHNYASLAYFSSLNNDLISDLYESIEE